MDEEVARELFGSAKSTAAAPPKKEPKETGPNEASKNLQKEVTTALGDKKSSEIVALIKAKIGDGDASYLVDPVAKHVFGQIFADKSFNETLTDEYKSLFRRIATTPAAQANILSVAQEIWFTATQTGTDKGTIKTLFEKLYKTNIVNLDGVTEWRDNEKNKGKAKSQALIKVNTWLSEIIAKAKPPEEADEEEADEEEEEDAYLQNPNKEFLT